MTGGVRQDRLLDALGIGGDHGDATLDATLAHRRKEVELDESFGGERRGDREEESLACRLEKTRHRAPTVVRASLGGTLAMPRASSSRST